MDTVTAVQGNIIFYFDTVQFVILWRYVCILLFVSVFIHLRRETRIELQSKPSSNVHNAA